MKKSLYIITILLNIVISTSLFSGPFLTINDIEYKKSFPEVIIKLTVKNIQKINIIGLDESNLLVYEDGFRVNYVKVNNLAELNDILYLVFSIDSSNSISKSFQKYIKKAAKAIVQNAGPRDKIAVYKFNDKVTLLNSFTTNKQQLIQNIDTIARHGKNTLLYNSIFDSINLLSDFKGARKAVIVFTDGKDEGSSVNKEDIVKFSKVTGIPIYFICLKNSKNLHNLARIAKLTGGKLVYSKNIKNLSGMYKTILSFIKSKYVIQYKSMMKFDGKKHLIEVRLVHKNIRDRETKEIVLKKNIFSYDFISNTSNVMLLLIFLLLALLFILLIYFIIREKKNLKMIYTEKELPQIKAYYSKPEEVAYSEPEESVVPLENVEYGSAWLIEKIGNRTGEKYPIYWDELTIGSEENNGIVIRDKYVSATHAKIKNMDNTYYLFDLVSETGTFLNNKKLLRPKALYDWDEVRIGKTILIFRGSTGS